MYDVIIWYISWRLAQNLSVERWGENPISFLNWLHYCPPLDKWIHTSKMGELVFSFLFTISFFLRALKWHVFLVMQGFYLQVGYTSLYLDSLSSRPLMRFWNTRLRPVIRVCRNLRWPAFSSPFCPPPPPSPPPSPSLSLSNSRSSSFWTIFINVRILKRHL